MTKHLHSNLRFLFLVPCFIFGSMHAQNVSVAGATVGNGSYANLATAFTAINGSTQTGTSITVSILANTTEGATATLNANDWKSLSIVPSGGARSISGNVSTALINLSAASNVLIDGLNAAGNSLTIDNAATGSTSTILFNNDCKNITVQNCSILGSATTANSGTLFFGAAAVSGSGNDLIKIKSCLIDASSGGNPVNGIYSAGSLGQENNTDSILNSSIANFFNATLVSSGIMIGTGNTDWAISGCRFYQAASRTYTTANTHTAIQVLAGNGYSITDNIIGYATAAATGTYKMSGTVATRFIGIDLSVGTATASSVQGNTITAIDLATSSSVSTDNGVLCGIRANTGNINIGNVRSNIIGGSSGVDLIVVTPSVTLAAVVGINSISSGTVLIKNNIIGGLTASNPSALIGGSVYGIMVSGVATAMTISDNIIGNNAADNIRSGILGTTTATSYAAGIYCSTTPDITTITNNKIQNISAYGANSGSYVRGIFTSSATNNSSPLIISGNTITKLISNSSLPSPLSAQTAAGGITVSIGTNDVVADNVISDIALIGTNASNTFAVGISHANGTNTTIKNNKISGITNASTSVNTAAPGIAAGILIRSGMSALNIINNMISLGNASGDNTAFIGIMANHGAAPDPTDNIYHNTVNISGTASSGAQPSFGFLRGDFTTTLRTQMVNIKNNIFTNSRSGGTGSHFAIGNNYNSGSVASSATGWGTNVSNNNILNADAATIGWWTSAKTFAAWKGASAGDSASFSGYTVTYVNPVSDLHLNMGIIPNVIESKGQTIGSVTTDIDGDVRPGPAGSIHGGALAPDIGADEFDGVMQDFIPPTVIYAALPAACDTLDRILTATIADAGTIPSSGALQPRVYYSKNKGPWVSSQGALTGGTTSNGTWTFTLLSASMGGIKTTDSVSYFIIAQDISGVLAASPSAGVVATDVNNVTAYPTLPNVYAFNSVPKITSTIPSSICDSGKVTLHATANAGDINWYTTLDGNISKALGTSFTTPLIKTTTSYYIDATYNGCTSPRVTVVATVNHSMSSTLTTGACDSLKWNGTVYKTSGTYLDTIPTVKGCDSLMTLNLTINHPSTSTQTIKACDAYPWNGNVYTTSGVYTDTIVNKTGCDSLMTLNLTINNSSASTESQFACDTYTWRGKTYITSGTYKDTIPNKVGCDSVLSLNLTINHSSASIQIIKACEMYTWNGTAYYASGTYKDTISNKTGCDSLMTLNLTITNVNATVKVNNTTITADSTVDSYQWILCSNGNSIISGANGQSYTALESGSYAVIETKNGCVDTSMCSPIVVTGITEAEKNAVRFYPNPGKGLYTLTLPEQAEIKIVNLTGAVIFDEKLSKGDHTLDLLNTTNGVYIMQVHTNETVSVFKLIKEE